MSDEEAPRGNDRSKRSVRRWGFGPRISERKVDKFYRDADELVRGVVARARGDRDGIQSDSDARPRQVAPAFPDDRGSPDVRDRASGAFSAPVENHPGVTNELGPVDYLVVEFPADVPGFTKELTSEIGRLVDSGVIRLLDFLVIRKDEDGNVQSIELDDIERDGTLRLVDSHLAGLLAADDVDELATAMDPGSSAGVIVWENRWAAAFTSAARRSGGQLIATGRIPEQVIEAALEAEEQ
jgi:hypothetical protein